MKDSTKSSRVSRPSVASLRRQQRHSPVLTRTILSSNFKGRYIMDQSEFVIKAIFPMKQVKISVPEDCFSKVRTKSKSSRPDSVKSKKHLAWYVALNEKPTEKKSSCIPQIKWTCPPKFCLNTGWHVAAGEGSQEAEAHKNGEIHLSANAIPPNSLNSPGENHDNSQIPVIPIIPIEEAALDTVNCLQPPISTEAPSVSRNVSLSQGNLSVSGDQSVKDKSLVNMLRDLEEGDLEVAAAAAATVAAVIESREQIDTQLLIKLLTDPEMINKLIDENGLGGEPQHAATIPPQIPTMSSFPLPTSTTPANKCIQPFPSISTPQDAVNQSLPLLCSKAETAINKSEGLKLKPIYTSKPVKTSMPLLKPMPAHSHIHQIAGVKQQVRPPMPSTLRPDDDEMITRLINKYKGPHLTGVMPVAPLKPSTSKPNIEAIKKLINDYGASDARPNMGEMHEYGVREHAWGKPFLGPNSLLLASTPLKTDMVVPPTANLLHVRPNAFDSNLTSRSSFHFTSFSTVNISSPPPPPPPPVDLNYYKSLIKQHGEKHENEEHKFGNYLQGLELAQNTTLIEMNSKCPKPCLYFNSTKGCRNGANCPYYHDMSKQQKAGALVDTPVTKRMKFLI
ncbi:hypothetical protein BUALT_Bualt04G0046200 [Buddleja alternifolia]|uniref:C3H1-type domain-containing protein n=1 Tax=Buddleja alternifolia TaxID=168488 RepID=A0AAV6XTW5_9LAMI|nr:hypothetical protein BUALT_Bualt04G0046200 [Buddleja alternifolia]